MTLEARVRHLVVVGSACQTGVTGQTGTGGAGGVARSALVGEWSDPIFLAAAYFLAKSCGGGSEVQCIQVRFQSKASPASGTVSFRGALAGRAEPVAHVAVVARQVQVGVGVAGSEHTFASTQDESRATSQTARLECIGAGSTGAVTSVA